VWIGRFDEPVVGPSSIAARSDESGATQVREVPRNLRLICLENLDAIADASFLVTEKLDETQTGAVGQGFEKRFEISAHSVADYDLDGSGVRKGYVTQRRKAAKTESQPFFASLRLCVKYWLTPGNVTEYFMP
jgi:hypothetical protein